MYEKLSTQKVTSDFNHHRPFAQNLASQNSKGKYKSVKILNFVRKMRKIDFFRILGFLFFLLLFNYFEVLYYFGIFKFFCFFEKFEFQN
jgi:hypothetical protein